ncbi:MAG: PIG-L family deacetylase [Acidobacteria bacterium]|nr:PIG-L family deacetylase [Acidobacteriota bacterium]
MAFLLVAIAIYASTARAQPKVLLVVAHPDDEYYFAATTYRIARELGGTVDQVIITNGEAGFKYSALAEKYYSVELTQEAVGRARLPELRRQEALRAGEVLGIRQHYFLNECDTKFTLDPKEALGGGWDARSVRRHLRELMEHEQYDFIFTLLPRSETHGHHQAATILAVETAAALGELQRPVVLAAEPGLGATAPVPFTGHDHTAVASAAPSFEFNRSRPFGFKNALNYNIVVNWMIAEHKSQGMFQNDSGKHDRERFWLFTENPAGALDRAGKLFSAVNQQ